MRVRHLMIGLLWLGGLVFGAGLGLSTFVPACGCGEPPTIGGDTTPPAVRAVEPPTTFDGELALGGLLDGAAPVRQDDEAATSLDEFLRGIFGEPGSDVDLLGDGGGISDMISAASDGQRLDASEIYARVAPAVAFVETADGTGSGILIDADHVVTNAHVVWPWGQARVRFPDGTEFSEAPVVGWDLMADFAVLELPQPLSIEPARLASDGIPATGSDVYLVGYPLEEEQDPQPAITRGLVSRQRDWVTGEVTYIQTDATIAGGQSGGALVDERGEVIGVSAMSFGAQGGQFAFAIAIDELRERSASLMAGDDVDGLGDRYYALVDPDDGRLVEPGQTAAAALDYRGDVDSFEIDLEAGETVLVGVTSVHFTAAVSIELEGGGDSGSGAQTGLMMAGPNSVMEFTATESGRHVISVGDMRGEISGAGYYLMIR